MYLLPLFTSYTFYKEELWFVFLSSDGSAQR